LSFVVDV